MPRSRISKNTHYFVKNVKGTGRLSCGCTSWIAHWRSFTRSRRATCAVMGCTNEAQVGAHVRSVDGRTDTQWWIAPFCRAHNLHTNEQDMILDSRVRLVAARKDITCG